MAGTPTTNYNFPTYADTDVPDLTGAYNQAVNAIDAKIKEVADTIPSGADVPDATSTTKGIAKLYDSATIGDSTQNDGGVTPAAMKAAVDGVAASISGKQDKLVATAPIDITGTNIGVAGSIPEEDGTATNSGVVTVTGKQEDIASATSLSTSPVPNAKAVKDYVDAKVPVEQQAYTGTAPITVDASKRAIGINPVQQLVDSNYESFISAVQENPANAKNYNGSSYGVVEGATVANAIYAAHDNAHNWPAAFCVPNLNTVMQLVLGTFKGIAPVVIDSNNKTISVRDATTSVKGVVQLTSKFSSSETTMATTGSAVSAAINSILNHWGSLQNAATTPLTTEMLANLYVTPSGIVVYKAPTE